MYKTLTESRQFKLYAAVALAALLMTLLAVTLTAGQAQATTTATLATDGEINNSLPQQQATTSPHATPEACPEEGQAASVVDSGHYALFDVWWNDEEGELTNTVCPPSVEYVPAGRHGEARTDRAASSIDITAEPPTIIHIPSSAKVTLSESDYPSADYKEVWEADDAENPNGDGNRMVWVLPACPPNGPATSDLCISYSAALLNPADWTGDIEFIVTHVHQVDIDKQDQRYVVVYDVPEGEGGKPELRWYSSDQDKDIVLVAAGGYDRPMWFFPSQGAYEFQVYIKGSPDTEADDPISEDKSVSSDLREYILHVGAEADLSAAMTVTPESPSPGDDVTIVLTAGSAGPDTAEETKVDVALPEGLTFSSAQTATGTYDSTTGVWTIGNFANGASATLTITATVDAETHGQDLTVKAAISATETVTTNSGTYDVPVPDQDASNDMDTGTVTVASITNVNPMFAVIGSVPENSSAGIPVGGLIAVREPDDGDTLTFTLSGDGAEKFTVSSVSGGAQIAVASGANLDYETTQSYDLTLGVSDGKDANSNADSSIDHTIAVAIEVTDDRWDNGRLSVTPSSTHPSLENSVTFTAEVTGLPAGHGSITYSWETRAKLDGGSAFSSWDADTVRSSHTYEVTSSGDARLFQVRVTASVDDDQGLRRTIGPVVAETQWQ